MADVKWIKLDTDIFNNRKIKYLRTLPEGNNIVLIWIMLLTLAGQCNDNGNVFFIEDFPYTTKMLSQQLDFEENTVILALSQLEKLGMISTDGYIQITGWEEHQNIEGMDKIREQNRLRKQRQRERQKALPAPDDMSRDMSREVTQQNKNKKENKNKEIYIYIVEYLNKKAGTHYKASSNDTQRHINARLSEGFKLEDFYTVIDNKCDEWLGDEKMQMYLRPATLFGTKFESYLNSHVTKKQSAVPQEDMNDLDEFF